MPQTPVAPRVRLQYKIPYVTPKIYRHFVETARSVSLPLHAAITQVGRIELPERRRRGFVWFLSRVIAGQQLSTAAARSIWARVEITVRAEGSAVPEFFRGRNAHALRQCGMSNAKIKALIALREAHAGGVLSVRRLRKMSHAERSGYLQEIRGIGQWTADMASIFFFQDSDVWPESDVGVQRGLEMIIGKRSRRTVLRIANSFSPYRSFLALYMWQVLDAPRAAPGKAPSDRKQPV